MTAVDPELLKPGKGKFKRGSATATNGSQRSSKRSQVKSGKDKMDERETDDTLHEDCPNSVASNRSCTSTSSTKLSEHHM